MYRGDINKIERKHQMCFSCKKSVGKCNWSSNFKPVDGWIAEKVFKKGILVGEVCETYKITFCPEYEYDGMCSKCIFCPDYEKKNPTYASYCPYFKDSYTDVCKNFNTGV